MIKKYNNTINGTANKQKKCNRFSVKHKKLSSNEDHI